MGNAYHEEVPIAPAPGLFVYLASICWWQIGGDTVAGIIC